MKKVVRTVILSVLAFCFSIACKNYTANIDDYLSYWSTEASIAGYAFDTVTQTDAEGTHCVPSKDAVTVTFTLRNPKNFHFRMPGDSGAPADIITFPQTQNTSDKRAAAPQSGNDYEFKKISNTKLALTYNPAFLQNYEWGRGDITPSIILYTTDGRHFKQDLQFALKVNTPPPAIQKCIIAQTKTASSSETSYYVLCSQLSDDDMKKTCGNGLLHEDIAGIEIAGIPYNLSVDGTQKQLKVQNDSPFIGKDTVEQLNTPDAEEIPSDWTLYLKTDVEVKADSPKTEYTVRLKDAKGLYSEPVTVGTQGKIITVTFNLAGGNIGGNTNAITMTGLRGTPFTKPADPIKEGYTFNGWNPPLPTPPVFPAVDTEYIAQWTKAGNTRYIIEHYQQNIDNNNYTRVSGDTQSLQGETGASIAVVPKIYEGFTPAHQEPLSPTIAADGSTVVKVYYKRNRVTVTFKLDGGNINGSTADVTKEDKFGAAFTAPENPTKDGYTFNGWAPSLPSPLTFPVADTAYTAQWIPKTYTVKFKVNGEHGSLTGTYEGADKMANSSTEQQFESVPHNSTINFTAMPDSGYEVDGWTDAVPDSGDNKKASLTVRNNVTVTVTFKAGGGQSPAVNTWEALRTAVQDASDGAVIEIAQNITYDISAAVGKESIIKVTKDITIKSTESHKYILNAHGNGADGGTAGSMIKGIFEVDDGKTLTLENLELTMAEKYAVYVAENSSLTMKNVTIKDCKTNFNAAGVYFNKGKNLTLENCTIEKCKGKSSLSSGGINIQEPKGTVSIKDTTIEKCEATGTYSAGGGIHLYKGTCTLEKVTIQECKAPKGGGIFVSENAECILKQDVTIFKNEATGTNSNGGGIFVSKNADSTQFGTLTIKGTSDNPVTISENKAEYGGGLYNFGTVTIKNAKIEKNEVPHHGGGMVNAETCTMDSVKLENNKAGSEGGGIYSSKVLTLKDTTVTGNEATMSGGAIQIATADSVFNMSGSTVITAEPSGGPGKPSKNDIYLTNTAFITLTGALTAAEKIARITLNSSGGYQNNREIVKGDSDFTIPSGYDTKFEITDKIGNPQHWKLIYQSKALKLKQN